jgi:DNA-binding Xre family transcriptional regulator
MPKKLGYRWNLRLLMAERGMYSTTDIAPELAARDVSLSAAQVYRLVAQTPERLNLQTLVALCDILGCTPSDLIEPVVESVRGRSTGTAGRVATFDSERSPRRAEVAPER